MATSPRRWSRVVPLAIAVVVVAVDQVTKSLALRLPATVIAGQPAFGRHVVGPVYLELTFNKGAAFGLGSGVTPIVVAVVVVLVVGLLLFGGRWTRQVSGAGSVGLGLLAGGALGNLGDRLFRHNDGAVIDFINVAQVGRHEYWPVFNVADAAIVVGALLLALHYSRGPARSRKAGADG